MNIEMVLQHGGKFPNCHYSHDRKVLVKVETSLKSVVVVVLVCPSHFV